MYLRKLIKVDKKYFFNKSNFKTIIKKIKNGDVFYIPSILNQKTLRNKCKKILDKKRKVSNVKILEGVENIFYESKNKNKKIFKNRYVAKDKSWYFFPWNEDKSQISKLVQPTFNNIMKINGYDPKKIIKLTPKNGIVQRFHLIFYPNNSGKITTHYDPSNIVDVQSGIYVTSYEKDYSSGGFYILKNKKKKFYIDHYLKSGDLILFSPKLFHGVTPVKCRNLKNSFFKGRLFLNMNLVESHHVKNRHTARAANFV